MFQGKLWNFRNMMRSSVPTKRISRIFDIGDLRSGHFCDLPIMSMGKKSTPLYLLWRKPIWMESYRIGHLRTIRVKICIAYPSKGHLRSPEVTNRHLPITFDRKEIETWDWCHYVRLGQANWLICNITHFGHHVTLAWLHLRSNFDLDLAISFYIWFDASQRDKHDGIKIVALPLQLKILSSKNRFGKFLNFDPWRPQFWPETKNDRNDFEMIFRELSKPAFRFSLRRPGAEIMGGVQTPPPPAGSGKSRGPAGRGLKSVILSFVDLWRPKKWSKPISDHTIR